MKKGFEVFLEQSGLTMDEGLAFLDMKIKQKYPETKQENNINIEFINRISKEAKDWKNNGL